MTREEIIKKVEERVQKELEGKVEPEMLGYVHIFEDRKKEILKEEYGIEYQTLEEKYSSKSID